MADLITSSRAKYAINQSSFSSAENTTIDALVTAVSKAIRKFCAREFDSQSFDELHSGHGDCLLQLPQYPILSVSRVAGSPQTVLLITNTSGANQRATVAVTSTGLTLVRVASGSSSTDTSITWSGNATLQAVRDAVNALGNGWSARLPDSRYALWPSADLRAIQGALNAKDLEAGLVLHVDEIYDFEVDASRGQLIRENGGWTPGVNNYRVIYTAGYSTVPEDVQEACAQWVAALFWATKENPAAYPTLPHPSVAALLAPYRRVGI
jgi:hypothetical protein